MSRRVPAAGALPSTARRSVLRGAVAVAAVAGVGMADGSAQRSPSRVGFLAPTAPRPDDGLTRITAALATLGLVEGRNLVTARRYASGDVDALPRLARELVALPVDVLVVVGLLGARAAQQATKTVPIVFYGNLDPLRFGLVQSLSRPGGNLTGVLIAPDGTLAAKRLELLRQTVPAATRIGVLAPQDPNFAGQLDEVKRAAARSAASLVVVEVVNGDYGQAFAKLAAERVQALFVGAHTFFVADRERIVALAAQHALPATYEWPEQVEAGGLMSYGSDLADLHGRVAAYVARILKGAKAGEMPVDRPTTLRLVLNLRTAEALRLSIPPSVLQRADRVIR